MVPHSVIRLVRPDPATKDSPVTGLLKRISSGQYARTLLKQQLEADTDPYLLLLLADQELVNGRDEQARYLVEAAYEVFDQKAEASSYKRCQSDQ